MKDYYQSIELEEIDQPKNDPPKKKPMEGFNREWPEAMADINKMIVAIETGRSGLIGATALVGSALKSVLSEMHTNPTKENIENFLSIVQQDLNTRCRQEIEKVFDGYPAIKDFRES